MSKIQRPTPVDEVTWNAFGKFYGPELFPHKE